MAETNAKVVQRQAGSEKVIVSRVICTEKIRYT